MKTRNVFFLAGVLLVAAGISAAYPTPAVVQKMDQWTLKTTYTQPEQITLQLPNEPKPRRFWYSILTVTNETSLDDVPFFPVCQLVTDTFEVIGAGKKVPGAVFETIKRKHQGSYPFLESLDFKDHRILRGADNTRDFAIIWPDFGDDVKKIDLFISGLSNETAVVEHPKLKDEDGRAKKIFLQKTLQLTYTVGGDPKLRANVSLKQNEQDWVMR
jgi:hypothetical protein